MIDIQITDKGDGTFVCMYVPTKPLKHTIIITWGEVNVPKSPFRVSVPIVVFRFGLFCVVMTPLDESLFSLCFLCIIADFIDHDVKLCF